MRLTAASFINRNVTRVAAQIVSQDILQVILEVRRGR
jgi:hypothetical protein